MFDNEELIKETKSQALNSETVGDIHVDDPRIIAKNINVFYGDKPAINNASIDIGKNEVLAMIGPSGCGKSTFLRCLNRMNDTIDTCRVEGELFLDNENILDKKTDVVSLRAKVGMVFQTQVAYLIPIFGVIFGYIIMDEQITWKVLASLIIIISGIYFVKRGNKGLKNL